MGTDIIWHRFVAVCVCVGDWTTAVHAEEHQAAKVIAGIAYLRLLNQLMIICF